MKVACQINSYKGDGSSLETEYRFCELQLDTNKKAKERLTIVAVSLLIYIVFIDPLIKWFNLEDSNVLSDWYFAIVLPIINLIFYGLLFLIFYCIVVGFMWIFGIEDKE